MRVVPILLAGLLGVGLAGCTGGAATKALDSIYSGPDFAGHNATLDADVIAGSHLEGRIGEEAWAATANLTIDAGNIQTPPMSTPMPQGGGGEATKLTLPGNATVSLRIREGTDLSGYTAMYTIVYGDGVQADGNVTGSAPAGQEFKATLAQPGPFAVFVRLTGSSGAALYTEPFRGRLAYRFAATGQVQPEKPNVQGISPPSMTPDDQMLDTYALDVPSGVPVAATTGFDGTYTPNQGTDVDLGIYSPGGQGVACSASGGSAATAPVDPAQAVEGTAYDTDASGAWSVRVGDVDGCGGTGYQYTNAGPVPYTLAITVG